MFGKLKNLLSLPLSPSERVGFKLELMNIMRIPLIFVAILVAIFEAVMLVLAFVRPPSDDRHVFVALYSILLGITVIAILVLSLGYSGFKKCPGVFLMLSQMYALFICLWGSYMTAFTYRYSADLAVFMYVILIAALVIPSSSWQAFLIYAINEIVFLYMMYQQVGEGIDTYSGLVNSIIATMLAIAVSSILYQYRMRNYCNHITITEKNSEIMAMNKRLQELVYLDTLTGAHNRRYLDEKMADELALARGKKQDTCMMMMDLDNFKQYNDTYGHQAGDVCLKTFAQILGEFMQGRMGSFVRYGGEEFLLMLHGCSAKGGAQMAEELRSRLVEKAIEHKGDPTGYLTVSIGLCASDAKDDAPLSSLINEADQALYIAKFAGRNRVKIHYSGLV